MDMSSERQTQSSRANGAKSRGPLTTRGKRASSRNAITHGMLADAIVMEDESEDRFRALLTALHNEFKPQTPFEESLIENMAAIRWRQIRIWEIEKAGLQFNMTKGHVMVMNAMDADAGTRKALAFRQLGDDSHTLDLINRYESRYERQYFRAHRFFLEARDRRTQKPFCQTNPATDTKQ
jgi:hypothetical protein